MGCAGPLGQVTVALGPPSSQAPAADHIHGPVERAPTSAPGAHRHTGALCKESLISFTKWRVPSISTSPGMAVTGGCHVTRSWRSSPHRCSLLLEESLISFTKWRVPSISTSPGAAVTGGCHVTRSWRSSPHRCSLLLQEPLISSTEWRVPSISTSPGAAVTGGCHVALLWCLLLKALRTPLC